MDITRRDLLGGIAASAAAAAVFHAPDAVHAAAAEKAATMKKYKNEDFYKGGRFDADAAKNAYYEMMRYYNYPIPERLHTADFWTLDFSLGKFTEAGMAGIFWVNNKQDNYFGHEIYLLPGQMIPEHKHVKTDVAAKMEGWHVRHGWIYTYGEGAPTPGVDERIPPSHRECVKSRSEHKLMPGEVGTLGGVEQVAFHGRRPGRRHSDRVCHVP